MKPKIAIIDYGMGNLRSVQRGLEKSGANAIITSNKKIMQKSDALVLPGVGAFCDAMKNLKRLKGIFEKNEKPVLGICLGLQLFFEESEEGGLHKGLGLVKGRIARLPKGAKIPQMGWNTIKIERKSKLLEGINSGDYFYFVHSYYALPEEDITTATAEYGTEFPAIIEKNNLYATQFHPEKSGEKGLKILENFVRIAKSKPLP